MDIAKLQRFNDWWETGRVRESLLKPYKRPVFASISKYLKDRQILLIYGLRRVGKTTLLYQIIDALLKEKTDPKKILYFSFDETPATLDDLLKTYEAEILKTPLGKAGKLYIFLDEVQKAENWQSKIKIFYDLYPNIKFLLSGSASISIQRRMKESLAGRVFDFHLKPLGFLEFLKLRGQKFDFENWKIYENSVLPLFYDYLKKGGFPEILEETDEEKISYYLKNAVIEKILAVDLPQEFGLKDVELLKTLTELIASEPGLIINYDSLAKSLQRSKPTIINYIYYLEYALVARLLKNFRVGVLSASRKMKKLYFSNAAFCFLYSKKPNDEAYFGKVIENLIVQETGAEHYFRENGEIDIIVKRQKDFVPIEVKYGRSQIEPEKFEKLLRESGSKFGIIITKDLFREVKSNDVKILFIPAWLFILSKEKFLGQ